MNLATAENTNEDSSQYAISAEKLNLWYGSFQALYDIDLNIKSGMITSLIGPSGCGKSTFLRSINRINERLGYVRINGSIDVESQLNSGTKFTIRLPIIQRELSNSEKMEIQGLELQQEKYILLVEDELAISDIQYGVLSHEPCNHKVDIANNGQLAMDMFDWNEYDLVSLDYIL